MVFSSEPIYHNGDGRPQSVLIISHQPFFLNKPLDLNTFAKLDFLNLLYETYHGGNARTRDWIVQFMTLLISSCTPISLNLYNEQPIAENISHSINRVNRLFLYLNYLRRSKNFP